MDVFIGVILTIIASILLYLLITDLRIRILSEEENIDYDEARDIILKQKNKQK